MRRGAPFAPPELRAKMGQNAALAQSLAARMANARVKVFEGVGHLGHLEATQAFQRDAAEFSRAIARIRGEAERRGLTSGALAPVRWRVRRIKHGVEQGGDMPGSTERPCAPEGVGPVVMRLGPPPDKSLLDPIETASRDEITALQTRRLAATLRRTYNAVPAMRAKFDEQGVHPDDFRALADLERFPFTAKADLQSQLPVRPLRRAEGSACARPRFVGHDGQADGGRLYAATISTCGARSWRERSAPPAGARA